MNDMKLRWPLLLALPLLTSAACGGFCRGYTDNSLHESRFTAPERGVALEIDRGALRVTLREGDRTVERAFTVLPEGDRPLRCPTQAGATRVEVLDLGPESLAIAGRTFAHPMIEAACGDRRDAILVDKSGTVEQLVFAPGDGPAPAPRRGEPTPPSATPEGVSPRLDARAASELHGEPARAGYLVWSHPVGAASPETLWVESGADGAHRVVARRDGVLLVGAGTLWSVEWATFPYHEVACDDLDRVDDEAFVSRLRRGEPRSLPLPVARGLAGDGAGTRWVLQSPQDSVLASAVPWDGEFDALLLAEGAVTERTIQFTGGAEGELWLLLREAGASCGEEAVGCIFYAPELGSARDDDEGREDAILDPGGEWATKKLYGARTHGLGPLFEEVAGRFEARLPGSGGQEPEGEGLDDEDAWQEEAGFDPESVSLAQVWQLTHGGAPEGSFVFTYPDEVPPLLDGLCAAPVAVERRRGALPDELLALPPAPEVVRSAIASLPHDTPFGWSSVPETHRGAMFRAFSGR